MPATSTYSDDVFNEALGLARSGQGQVQQPAYDDSLFNEALALARSQVQPAGEPEESGGILSPVIDYGKGLVAGVRHRIPEMVGQAGEFLGIESAGGLTEFGRRGEDPTLEKGAFRQAGEMTGPSVGIPFAMHALGTGIMYIPHPAAKLAGGALKIGAYALTPAMFGLAQAQQTKETAERAGVDPGTAPLITGGIETAGETIGNAALLRLLGPLAPTVPLAKAGAKQLLKSTIGRYGRQLLLKTLPTEISTEIGQAYGQAAVEQAYDIRPDAEPIKEAMSVIAPTAIMTIVSGTAARAYQNHQGNVLLKNLEDPEAEAESRSDAVNAVASIISAQEEGGEKPIANLWLHYGHHQVDNGLPIDIDRQASELDVAAQDPQQALAEIKAGLEAGTITPEQALESAQNPGVQAMGIANEVADLANEYTVEREAAKPLAPEAAPVAVEPTAEPVAEPIVEPAAPAEPTLAEQRQAEIDRQWAEQERAERLAVEIIEEREAAKAPELKPAKPREVPAVPTEAARLVEPKKKKPRGPEGLIGRINQEKEGRKGIYFGKDYHMKELRQYPDIARVMQPRGVGVPFDELVASLQTEGYDIRDEDHLFEMLQTGQARKMYTIERRDEMLERDTKRWAEEENIEADNGMLDYLAENPDQIPAVWRGLDGEQKAVLKEIIDERAEEAEPETAGEIEAGLKEKITSEIANEEGITEDERKELGAWFDNLKVKEAFTLTPPKQPKPKAPKLSPEELEHERLEREEGQRTIGEVTGVQAKFKVPPPSFGVRGKKVRGEAIPTTAQEDLFEKRKETTLFEAARKQKRAKAKEVRQVHDFSNTQINLPSSVAKKVTDFGKKIPDSEIYEDPKDDSLGRETAPHITVRYGLDETDTKKLTPAFKAMEPIKATIGKVSIFEADEYDVIKADIESEDLKKANKIVGEAVALPGETHKKYIPHTTIAYVNKGEGKKYVGDTSLEGTEITVDTITLSDKTGKDHDIKLTGKPAEKPPIAEPKVPKEEAKVPAGKPGSVFIENKQYPFREYYEFTKGKNEGKIRVTLPDGKKKVVEKADVAKWPEGIEVEKAPVEKKVEVTVEDLKKAQRLSNMADGLQKQIDEKRSPAISQQNLTARRARIAASMAQDADRLEETQNILTGMANAIENGTLPESLKGVRNKAQVEALNSAQKYDWKITSLNEDEKKRIVAAGLDNSTLYERAKKDIATYIKGPSKEILEEQKLKKLERGLIGTKIPGFFPTPKPVINRMLEHAEIEPGTKVLEPSAGKGDIADVIREKHPNADLSVIEYSGTLTSILEAKGYKITDRDFLEHKGQYDRIVQNPPFEKGQDVDHVRHAYEQLNPEGRLVSVMSESPFFRSDKKSKEFRDWLDEVGGETEKLTEKSFTGKEAFRQTGVAGRIVTIEKTVSDIDVAKSRIVSALKDQRGSFSMKQKQGPAVYEDLLTVGKHYINQGHTKWSGFRLRMKDALSEIWDKVRAVISRVFRDATRILKSEKGAVTIEGARPPLAPEAPYGYGKTKTMQEILDSINAAQKRKPTEPHKAKNVTDKVGAIYNDVTANWRTRTIDRLYPLMQKLDQGLDITDPDMQAYIQGRMDTSTPTVVATFLQHGKLKWLENAPYVETKDKGFLALTEQYGINPKAVDSYDSQIQTLLDEKIGYKPKTIRDIDRYLFWKVASRAEKLTAEEREHLFTKDDIALLRQIAGKDWKGTALDKQYVAFNKNVLDFAQQVGLIDPSMRRVWEHDEYIPFYRILEDELLGEEFLRAPIKTKKFIDSQIKKLVGGTEKLGDPFENILRNWSHLITESIRNRSRTTSYKYMEQLGYAEPSKPPKYIKHPEREAILNYTVKGKRKYFKVKDLELFNALSGTNIQKFDNILMRMFGRAKRLLTYGATFGPAFRVANMLRDTLQTAMVNRSFVPVWDSLQGVYKAWTEHPDYIAMMSSGGGFSLGYVRGDDPQAMARHVRKVVRKAHKKSNTLSPLNLLEWWERVGSASENAARVQLYANLRKKGTSHLVAGFKARDVLDFSLSGDSHLVQTMIRTMPFLGARMQGLYKMGRAYGEDKSAFLLKGAILAGLSLAWWAGIKDDDRYKELEDWEKWTYRHFWIGDTHFRLPRAFEVDALFSSSVESIADALSENEEGKHVMNFIGQTMRDTFALDVPQLVRPLYEQAKNEIGFTGRPIISESLKSVKPEDQAQPWTSESLRVLGGKLGVSPLRAEALVRGYLATLGMFILGATDVATQWAFDFPAPPKSRVDNYPLLGRFIREAPARHTKYVTRFYEMAREMDVLVGTINHYKRTGNVEKAVKLARTSRATLSYKKGINRVRLYLRNVNAKIKRIHYQKNLTAAQKKERINKLLDERNEMIKGAYESLISARIRGKK